MKTFISAKRFLQSKTFSYLSFSNPGVPLNLCRAALTQSEQVADLIRDVFYGVGNDFDTHPKEISGGHFENALGKLFAVSARKKECHHEFKIKGLLAFEFTCKFPPQSYFP